MKTKKKDGYVHAKDFLALLEEVNMNEGKIVILLCIDLNV